MTTKTNPLRISYELAVIVVGAALAFFGGWQSAVPWFVGYALGFHRGMWR